MDSIQFSVSPPYQHWRLDIKGAVARLTMAVNLDRPLHEGYDLKLNSYDLCVDIELADAVQRIRFEYPEVRTVVIGGNEAERVFCAGANIYMLANASQRIQSQLL